MIKVLVIFKLNWVIVKLFFLISIFSDASLKFSDAPLKFGDEPINKFGDE